MRAEKIKHEINRLELSEKLLLVEDIWDSIAASNSELPMHEWQKSELDKRYKEYKMREIFAMKRCLDAPTPIKSTSIVTTPCWSSAVAIFAAS